MANAEQKFKELTFTRDWTNPADFPTTQNDEAIVRADMQYLHEETRVAFNQLVSDLNNILIPLIYRFQDILHVEQTLSGDPTALPTSKAVQDALVELEARLGGTGT